MALRTYGEHQEAAARALTSLVSLGSVPERAQDRDRALMCREALVDAIHQRLHELGGGYSASPDLARHKFQARPVTVSVRSPASLVDTIAHSLPRLPPDRRQQSPLGYLAGVSEDSVTEAWRLAAVEALAASHALSSAALRPWRADERAGWWLMQDIATTLEAVVLADHRFEEAGLLGDHERSDRALNIDQSRLILNHAARTASRYATDPAPDDAVAQPLRAAPGLPGPATVSLVDDPSGLAPAQQRMALLLHTRHPHITADAIRHVASSQLYLCRAFETIAQESPRSAPLAAVFSERAAALADLAPHLAFLENRVREPQNWPMFWQQSELTAAVRRFRAGPVPRMAPDEVLSLARATHEAISTFQRALHRELTYRPKSTSLRYARPAEQEQQLHVRHRVISPDSPVVEKSAALGELKWGDIATARFSAPAQRAALARALDLTPHAQRRPSLFPPGERPYAAPPGER